MNDPYRMRRLNLLWEPYKSVPKGQPVILDRNLARAAKYDEDYGEQGYYRVFEFDVEQLEKEDGAITPATDHRGYAISQGTLYWITDRGMEMLLREAR
jgi:hypothetical protein